MPDPSRSDADAVEHETCPCVGAEIPEGVRPGQAILGVHDTRWGRVAKVARLDCEECRGTGQRPIPGPSIELSGDDLYIVFTALAAMVKGPQAEKGWLTSSQVLRAEELWRRVASRGGDGAGGGP